jgi:hypothetical protein
MAQWFRGSECGTLTGAWASVANLDGLTAAGRLMALVTLAGWRLSLGGVGLIMLARANLAESHSSVESLVRVIKVTAVHTDERHSEGRRQGQWVCPPQR